MRILSDMGTATLLTFATGVVIFATERLGLTMTYLLSPFPFLTMPETLLLLVFAAWTVWFLILIIAPFFRKPFISSRHDGDSVAQRGADI